MYIRIFCQLLFGPRGVKIILTSSASFPRFMEVFPPHWRESDPSCWCFLPSRLHSPPPRCLPAPLDESAEVQRAQPASQPFASLQLVFSNSLHRIAER